MTKRASVVLILVFGGATAWGQESPEVVRKDYDMKKLWMESQLPEPEMSGRRLFIQRCAICHDQLTAITSQENTAAQPFGPPLNRDTTERLGDAGARVIIANGTERMPGFRYALTPVQVDQILAFVSTLPPTPSTPAAPTASNPIPAARPGIAAPVSAPTSAGAVAVPNSSAPNFWGTVRSAEGKGLGGASVSARANGSTITVSVYTDEHGEFYFPRLDPGGYSVWTQGVGFETARVQITIDRATRQLFRLNRLLDYSQQLRGSDWFAILPERTLEQRHMKELIRVNCVECHALSVMLRQRFDEQGWLAILNAMERAGYDGSPGPLVNSTGDSGTETGDVGRLVIRRHKAALAKYLASFRGPAFSPSVLKTQPPPSGEAARVVVTEYDIPNDNSGDFSWSNGEDRSQGAASGLRGAMSAVHDLTIDDDGNPWVTSVAKGPDRSIAKIDAKTGQVTDFKMSAQGGATAWTHGMTKDAGGNLWADGDGYYLRMDPRTMALEMIRAPDGLGTGPRYTTDVDRNGYIWSGTRYGAVRFNPTTKRWNLYGNVTLGDGFSYGMVADGQGRGWWTQFEADRVEMADPATGRTTEYRMAFDENRASVSSPEDKDFYDSIGALEWGGMNTIPGSQAPRRLGADKAGNAVWVPLYHGQSLARIDTASGAIQYIPLPVPATPYFVTVDQHHNVWMNTLSDDALFRYDPASAQWTIFSLPSLGCDSRNMSLDEKSGDAWIACSRSIRVGRFHFRSTEELQAAREVTMRTSQHLKQ